MNSYWLVDHGISKSYVGGGKYVSATKMTKGALRNLQATRKDTVKSEKLAAKEHSREVHGFQAGVRSIQNQKGEGVSRSLTYRFKPVAGGKTKTLRRTQKLQVSGKAMPHGIEAYAIKSGGRKGTGTVVHPPGVDSVTMRHEAAHLTPKRSSYRQHQQIGGNPRKAMKEEARADFEAGTKYFNKPSSTHRSGYVDAARSKGDAAIMAGAVPSKAKMFEQDALKHYKRVQGKMHQAQANKRR